MAATLSKKGVRTKHKDYEKHALKWERCRDAMNGQDAVHAAGVKYLPQLKEQSNSDYASYKKRACWYNASWRTTAGLVGMMFRKPPKENGIPDKVNEYLKNVNLCGSDLTAFVKNVANDVLEIGRIGLLTDHPVMPVVEGGGEMTQAQADEAGLRPTIQSYDGECIINWKYRNISNQTMLCLVVLEEDAALEKQDDEFSHKTEKHYRVLDLDANDEYRVRVFRINEKDQDEQVGNDIWPMMNGKRLDEIPFVFIGPDGNEGECEEPPLIDLVDVNFSHYRVTADYEHGVHFSALPTFFISGYQPIKDAKGVAEKIYLGSQAAICLPDPGAKAGFAEITGDFKAHRENLDAKKQEMATLGARMLADSSTRQVETFGATAIKHVAENSILASIAIAISKGVKKSLIWFCEWSNAPAPNLDYDINRDYLPVQMDGPTLTAIMSAWQGGMLSEAEMFDLLKRGDVVEATKTLEEHQGEIDSAPPPAPPSNTQPGNLGTPTHDEAAQHAGNLANATNLPKPK